MKAIDIKTEDVLKALAPRIARRTLGGTKCLSEYSMGYRLTVTYHGVSYTRDTRKNYSGRHASRYTPTHPDVSVEVTNEQYKEGLKDAKQMLRASLKADRDRQERARREAKERHMSIMAGKYRPIRDGWVIMGDLSAITGLDTAAEAEKYAPKVRRLICSRAVQPVIAYLNLRYNNHWQLGTRALHPISYRDNVLPHTTIERQVFCDEIAKEETLPAYAMAYFLKNEPNEERKRAFAERHGGWAKILPEIARPVSTATDGVHPITLYRVGGVSYILCRDHSTERTYAICPPDQSTDDARKAWESTFPCAITYRHGDVGLTYVDDHGDVIDQNLLTQS